MAQTTLLLIGCGNIGAALLTMWAQHDVAQEIVVVQPSLSAQQRFAATKGITFVDDVAAIAADFSPDMVILAFKPQQLEAVLPHYQRFTHQAVVISLLAAISIERLRRYCQSATHIVRVMPNIAMQIGESINLIYADADLKATERDVIEQLYRVTGQVTWLNNERLIDLLTPIASSGLAYFFLLADLFMQAAIEAGLPPQAAQALVRQTLLGSALLASDTPDLDFKQLIAKVASKKGATEAGLALFRPALTDLVDQVLAAALKRIEQMNQ